MSSKSYLNICIGQLDPDTLDNMIFLDMFIVGEEIPIENSPDLEGMQEDEFCFHLEKLLNKAFLISRETGLKIRVDQDGILTHIAEEMKEESIINIRKLIQSALSEKGE